MKIPPHHSWPTTLEAATEIQQQLRQQVQTTGELTTIQYVAGVDVGFRDDGQTSQAAVAVLSFPDLQLVEQVIALRPTTLPYIPGYLSFREVPAVLDALEKLTLTPDLIVCDGQGIAHPRRFGIACHLGVILDLPTIGVAKSILIGTHAPLAEEKGQCQPLVHRGETVGAVLRTRSQVKPVYVSIGHRLTLETALDYVMQCTTKYRLPETTRIADRLSKLRDSDVMI